MLLPVIDQAYCSIGRLLPVCDDAAAGCPAIANFDVIRRLAIPVVDLETGPILGKAGREAQAIDLEMQPQEGFGNQAVHPTRRPGIPSPAAPTCVGRHSIDVGGLDVPLDYRIPPG